MSSNGINTKTIIFSAVIILLLLAVGGFFYLWGFCRFYVEPGYMAVVTAKSGKDPVKNEILVNRGEKGIWKEVLSENDLMIFKRELDDKSLYVYVNNSENERSFKKDGKRFHELFSNQVYENGIKISAYSFGIAEESSIHF